MAKTRNATSIFDDDVVEVSRAGLPDTGVRAPLRTKLYKSYVWAAVILLPLALMSLLVVANAKTNQANSTGQQGASTATSSPGRTAAELELRQWLAAKPSPLPGGQVLSWDKAETLPDPVPPKGSQVAIKATYHTEVDSFTVIDGQGRTYTAAVQVALDPRGGGAQALTTAGPALIPTTPAAPDQWASGPWPGLTASSDPSAAIATAITGWAHAYTSGSADSLRLAVGDTNGGDTYLPLSGVTSVTAVATYLAPYGAPGTMIARVTLNILWNGQQIDPNTPTTDSAPQTTMDVLVERATSGAPVVTAWGAPGTGPTLKDHQNAVTAPIAAPTASPTGGN